LFEDVQRLRDQLFAATLEKKIIGSADGGFRVAQVKRDVPTFSDQKTIMTAVAIAVDKIHVLTGAGRPLLTGDSADPDADVQAVAADVISLVERRSTSG
jgi:hypothetical protein